MLVLEEDEVELPTLMSVQEIIVPVDGLKILTLVLVFAELMAGILVHLPTSPLMRQVTRGCVAEQEDIRKESNMPS